MHVCVHVMLAVAGVGFRVREALLLISGPPEDARLYIFSIFSVNFPPTEL